ncbi:hypothetical protein ACTNEO_18610 [Gracilibacillus sp. HCP3S3_G5_1]|uniref:hypothetical protein n=1 Tax=unclassified Gracilibacillus TaxID=2625209 RepID=UPI003F8B1AE8
MFSQNIDIGWEFQFGERSSIPGMNRNKETVNLPHDFTIGTDPTPDARGGKDAGYFEGGIGTYTKMLFFQNKIKKKGF